MISEGRLKEIVGGLLAEHLEAQADWRSRVPSMVIIYPLDQSYLKSGFIGQRWMLKLCCMAPGEEHTLEGGEGAAEGETHPELGWYRLDDLGEWTKPIIQWAKGHERILKLVSKGLGAWLGWVNQDAVTSFLSGVAESASGLDIPDSPLPLGGGEYLPVTSELIRLAGLRESDYRAVEGQGLIFLKRVLEDQPCGNLRLFVSEGRMLWLCNRHLAKMKAERAAVETARREELLSKYLSHVESQVRKVRILGDSEPHDLKEVFVELTTVGERERPSSLTQAEHLGLLDSELRRHRNPLLDRGYGTNQAPRLSGRKVSPMDLLKSDVRPLIVGAPGSGKSTLLRYLAYKTLEEGEKLPLFLELKTIEKRDFDAAQGRLPDLIFDMALAKGVCDTNSDREVMREEFYQRLRAGRVSVFLDGLDEVSGKEFFGALRQSVKDFLQNSEYRQNNLYVSTRPYALRDRFSRDEAQEMEIAPFNQEQIEQFINHYYPGDEQANKFLAELRLRPELRELASVPALLGYLFLLYRKQNITPENRPELYRELVHHLVREWDREKGVERDFRTTEARRESFLSYLAFARLFSKAGEELSRNLIFTSGQILEDAERYCQPRNITQQADLLAEDVIATPLLRQVGTDTYAFAHLTIQEYMAATTLVGHQDCAKLFCRAYFDPVLVEMEVLPMTLGIAGQQSGLSDALDQLPESLDFKRLRLEAKGLRYGPVSKARLAKLVSILRGMITREDIEFGYFDAIVKSFRGSTSPAGEAIARSIKADLGNDAAVYRSYAVRLLGLLGSEAANNLLQDALDDEDGSVRTEAALFLGLNNDASAVEFLMKELDLSEDDDAKEEVVYALWQIGTQSAIEGLKTAVKDGSPFIRRRSLEGLAGLCGEKAIPILVEHLDDPDDFVRLTVVKELGEISGEGVIDALIEATGDDDSFVAEKAFTSLTKIGGPRVYQYLIDYPSTHTGQSIGYAAEALGKIGNAEAIPTLARLLEEYRSDDTEQDEPTDFPWDWENDYVRVRIAAALCQLGDERGRPVLTEAIEKGEELKYATKALSRSAGDEVSPLLLNTLEKYRGKEDSVSLAEALCNLNVNDENQIVSAMATILDKYKGWSYESLKVSAINVLGRIGGQLAVEGLTGALEEAHPFIQIAAIAALGNVALKNETAVPGLLGSLKGVNVVSEEAARVLARMDNSTLYEGLLLCLQGKNNFVRRKAAQSVVYYSADGRAAGVLSDLASNDPVDRVRNVARQALEQIEIKRRYFG